MKSTGVLTIALATAITLACNANTREGAPNEGELQRNEGVGTAGDAGVANNTGVSNDARDFVQQAAVGNMAEIELGQIASQRASNPEVKSFAEMMVRDHTRTLEEMKQLAATHSITTPAQLDQEHTELRNKLSARQGAEFDREYMNAMVQGHQDMVDLMQTRANEDRLGDDRGQVRPEQTDNPVDSALNQFAAKTLPAVRRHLDEARRVRDSLDDQSTRR